MALAAQAQSFVENFDVVGGTTTNGQLGGAALEANGWFFNNLSAPRGVIDWFQGEGTLNFPSFNGDPNAYISANFNNTTGAGTINNWMMTPVRTLNNGDTISFYTRTAANQFPDRLRLAISTSGASTNVANFTTVLSINENLVTSVYPTTWTQFTYTVTGLSGPTSGRFGFNYNVTNGGPNGNNSDLIGIDNVVYTAVPEPATMSALALGALALLKRRRRSA